MIRGLEQGEVGFLWIAATNPAVSMPDLERTKAALRRSPFTVYQDAYYPTETTEYAHVLLPAAQWGEKTGTMTNSERMVTLCPKFRDLLWDARADWEIFAEVGRRLGFTEQFNFSNSAQVHAEFVQLTRNRPCDMTGIRHDRLSQEGAIQWPCPDQEPGVKTQKTEIQTENPRSSPCQIENSESKILPPKNHSPAAKTPKRLYTDLRFNTPDGLARFAAYHSKGLAEPPDPDYPFVLTIGRLYGHWHTQTRTGRIEKTAQMHPNPFIEIHPRDAEKLGIADGDWAEIRSRRGKIRVPATVTKSIAPGTVFVPMHWGKLWADDAEANALTHPEACPISLQPELKACAVQIVKISKPLQQTERPVVKLSSQSSNPVMQGI